MLQKVAFLGPTGSYSHQAALRGFPLPRTFELEARTTIKEVFEAVQSKEAVFGVVPFENSSHGSVVQTLDLFSDRAGVLPDIHVCGEVYVDIDHCLLGFESGLRGAPVPSPGYATPTLEIPSPVVPRSHPIVDISHIKHVYSHPQAFGQSLNFINTYLRNAELHEASSTAKGAEFVSIKKDPSMAAIASEAAAEDLNLKVLAKSIQDRDDNTTRFFIIKRGSSRETDIEQTYPNDNDNGSPDVTGVWKTLVGFGIDHRKTGALADALNVFKIHDLNLTSINSRPSHRRQWHYIFLIEFDEKVEDGDDDARGNKSLKDLQQFTEEMRWYGSWRDRSKRPSPQTT